MQLNYITRIIRDQMLKILQMTSVIRIEEILIQLASTLTSQPGIVYRSHARLTVHPAVII